jgi:hypothetical protein
MSVLSLRRRMVTTVMVAGLLAVPISVKTLARAETGVHCPGSTCQPKPDNVLPWSSFSDQDAVHQAIMDGQDPSGKYTAQNIRFVDVDVSTRSGSAVYGSWLYGCTQAETREEIGSAKVEGTEWSLRLGILPFLSVAPGDHGKPGVHPGLEVLGAVEWARGEVGRRYAMLSSGVSVSWGDKARLIYYPTVVHSEGTVAADIYSYRTDSRSTRGGSYQFMGTVLAGYTMESPKIQTINGLDLQDFSAGADSSPMTTQEGKDRCGWTS